MSLHRLLLSGASEVSHCFSESGQTEDVFFSGLQRESAHRWLALVYVGLGREIITTSTSATMQKILKIAERCSMPLGGARVQGLFIRGLFGRIAVSSTQYYSLALDVRTAIRPPKEIWAVFDDCCVWCGQKACRVCSACKAVRYCSKSCQTR